MDGSSFTGRCQRWCTPTPCDHGRPGTVWRCLNRPMSLICGFRKKPMKRNRKASTSRTRLSGGPSANTSKALRRLKSSGRSFPDPEPRRLQRNADRHGRAVFFIEPLADDEDWGDYLTQEAKPSHTGENYWAWYAEAMEKERQATSVQRSTPAQGPIRGLFDSERVGRCLVGTFEWLSTPALANRRNERYAARVRGALASLRSDLGDDATLLLVVHQPHAAAMVKALDANRTVEEISSTATTSTHTEEE